MKLSQILLDIAQGPAARRLFSWYDWTMSDGLNYQAVVLDKLLGEEVWEDHSLGGWIFTGWAEDEIRSFFYLLHLVEKDKEDEEQYPFTALPMPDNVFGLRKGCKSE